MGIVKKRLFVPPGRRAAGRADGRHEARILELDLASANSADGDGLNGSGSTSQDMDAGTLSQSTTQLSGEYGSGGEVVDGEGCDPALELSAAGRGATATATPTTEREATQEHVSKSVSSNVMVTAMRLVDASSGSGAAPGAAKAITESVVYPSSHYTLGEDELGRVLDDIYEECTIRTAQLRADGQYAEAERLLYRVTRDLDEMRREGYCRGMENYSRHLAGRQAGMPPATLLDYMPDDWLLLVDESHLTVPQLGAMHSGDYSRKARLVRHGFRLPSALDNRPLTGPEFWERVPQAVLVSATPGAELAMCGDANPPIDLVVRPTGILDPQVHVVDTSATGGSHEDHLLAQVEARVRKGERALITCLTKRTAEELSTFLNSHGVRAVWLHSELKAAARLEALDGLRRGKYDVLVGCNLLREGIDLPEVSLVAIMGADKQGFLRSATSLIQTIGRAARHVDGTCLLYTSSETPSQAMEVAMAETASRRAKQMAHNDANGITPTPYRPRMEIDAEDMLAGGKKPPGGHVGALLEWIKGGSATAQGPPRPPGGSLEGSELKLYEDIRAWRGGVARANRKRPFMVLTEAVMQGLAIAKPTNEAGLLEIKGIGPKKADRYGQELLQLVASHINALD